MSGDGGLLQGRAHTVAPAFEGVGATTRERGERAAIPVRAGGSPSCSPRVLVLGAQVSIESVFNPAREPAGVRPTT